MNKAEYFPRKRLFEESQDLIATFYSTGEYISSELSEFSSMLTYDKKKDEFYYCLYLLSMMSNVREIMDITEKIIKDLNFFRKKRRVTSLDNFEGEIDIEEYIKKNYIEKVTPKEYPSIIKYSTYQLPEFQLTLFILRSLLEIYNNIFLVLGRHPEVDIFKKSQEYSDIIKKNIMVLSRRYGINYGKKENYLTLKKKVKYRYRNRKILTSSFNKLMSAYEDMILFRGIDVDSKLSLDLFEYFSSFDDRLYEIWLIRKSSELLKLKMGISRENIKYCPLFEARKNKYAVLLNGDGFRVEILFQNRKSYMPKDKLQWYYEDEMGNRKKIGAIPDLIFIKYIDNKDEIEQIVLVDAKNRTWTLDNMEPIKKEVVQQIYICDNFSDIFNEKFSSMLIAHNFNELQCRKFYRENKPRYEIDVVSICMKEERIEKSLDRYIEDLCIYLEI